MKRSDFVFPALLLFISVALSGTALAQSSNRDNPNPLKSGEISGSLNDHQAENFYSFTAGPGELTITVDVTSNRRDMTAIGVLNFELLGRDASTSLLCCEFAQTGDSGTGRTTKSVKLSRRQTVILHTTNGPVGGGTFRVRLGGATSFIGATGGARNSSDNDNDNNNDNNNNDRDRGDNDRDRGNRRGEQITVPASGILHIRMKDGTTRDIDLNTVRNISIRP